MAELMRMPEVAANGTEAGLQEWAVTEGASFAAGDVLATVETDKAVVDVEAEADGVLLRALVPPGATVEVGAPIAVLGRVGETVDDVDAVLASLGIEAGTAPGTTPAASPGTMPETLHAAVAPATTRRVFVSPLARRLAAEAGIPLEELTGTGPGGRIRRRDVEAETAARRATPRGTTPGAPLTPPATPSTTLPATAPTPGTTGTSPAWTDVPHTRMRRAIAARLTESKQTTPHFYLRASLRADRLLQLREELNAASDARISVTDLVLKAAARAHVLVPRMNVVWTPDALRSPSTVDIAVAVATDGGLLTPVVRDVATLSVGTLSGTVRDLVERARGGRLRQDELEGGTLSVTNLGMYGTEEFAAIINPPQSAILAVGAAREEPVVLGGELRVGTVMRVTLSVDHRAVDGADAAQWLAGFTDLVERPLQLLL